MPLRSPEREKELIEEVMADAEAIGVSPEYAAEMFELILRHSRAAQRNAIYGGIQDAAAS